jgi:heat-inducible transcriptional repressor
MDPRRIDVPDRGPGPLLSGREAGVLRLVVDAHVRDARPVASRQLVRRYGLPFSAATVHSTMHALSEKLLLRRPHPSSGREPTDRGYRYYVDHLMLEAEPSDRVLRMLESQLARDIADRRVLLSNLAHLVGVVSRQLGAVLISHLEQSRVTMIELVALSARRILLVIGLEEGRVRTRLIELQREVAEDDLRTARRLLGDGIVGRDLADARRVLDEAIRPELARRGELLERIAGKLPSMLADTPPVDLILGPPGELAMQAEFSRGDRLRELLKLIDAQEPLVRGLAPQGARQGVQIRIGEENGLPELDELSTVSVALTIRGESLVLGLLGPVRMDYPQAIALVGCLGRRLKEVL